MGKKAFGYGPTRSPDMEVCFPHRPRTVTDTYVPSATGPRKAALSPYRDTLLIENKLIPAASTAFILKASIKRFGDTKLPLIKKQPHYNDDIKIEAFQSSAHHHAGKQRNGVVDEHMECLSLHDHVKAALNSPFFLSLSIHLPQAIMDAATFIRDTPPQAILHFWDSQLNALDGLIKDASATELAWNKLIPHETAPAAGKLKLAAFMTLVDHCRIGV